MQPRNLVKSDIENFLPLRIHVLDGDKELILEGAFNETLRLDRSLFQTKDIKVYAITEENGYLATIQNNAVVNFAGEFVVLPDEPTTKHLDELLLQEHGSVNISDFDYSAENERIKKRIQLILENYCIEHASEEKNKEDI